MNDKKISALENIETYTIKSLDKASFEMLFRGHFSGLCFFAQKYVKDFEASKEIVQDAFLPDASDALAMDILGPIPIPMV